MSRSHQGTLARGLVPPARFALVRPSIMGAVAARLFFSYLLAILVASAVTFFLLGISVPRTSQRARRLARALHERVAQDEAERRIEALGNSLPKGSQGASGARRDPISGRAVGRSLGRIW